ncbi:hypothetical protein IWQ60_000483 [Tieghemiomyces parasiticus]|uniref:Calcium-activated potassium channel BK alpha subunit domain-containing protein n=1 Tax=Tieghemiomyces parasiticus TaxID=78921 RepID=A0A9W8AL27_9FUNG|nr:hypothetical protein IWQ60_000483 [Tieghemiomyces parasiticus]
MDDSEKPRLVASPTSVRPAVLSRRASSLEQKWPNWATRDSLNRLLLWVQRVAFFLDHSRLGRIWDFLDTGLNTIQVALFIWHTTATTSSGLPAPLSLAHRIPELVITLLLLGQFLIRHLLITGETLSLFMVVTLLDTLPPLVAITVSFANHAMYNSFLSAGILVIFYPIRFVRLQMSLNRFLAPGQNSIIRLSEFKRKIVLLVSDVAMALLAVAAVLYTWLYHFSASGIASQHQVFTYFDAFFFCAVSITAGPADSVVPDLIITRLVVIGILVLAALFLPAPIGSIVSLMQGVSQYTSYSNDPRFNHVMVCGSLDFMAVSEFLNEFYNEDHGVRIMHTTVVIVNDSEPDDDLRRLLHDPLYAARVRYYKGSPTSYTVLDTVRARDAKAIFILTSKFGGRSRIDEDAETVMRALAISSYVSGPAIEVFPTGRWAPLKAALRTRHRPSVVGAESATSSDDHHRHHHHHRSRAATVHQVRIYAQTLLPETETHFRALRTTRILAVEEFRMGLLAQSCATPGFSTLMHILTATLTDKSVAKIIHDLRPQVSPRELDWMEVYLQCATQEIYETRFPRSCVGLPYRSVVRCLYETYGVVVFAVGISRNRPRNPHLATEFHELYLNPINHVIRPNDIAFIIAHSSQQTDDLAKFPGPRTDPAGLDDYDYAHLLGDTVLPDYHSRASDAMSPEERLESGVPELTDFQPADNGPRRPYQPPPPSTIPISPVPVAYHGNQLDINPSDVSSNGAAASQPTTITTTTGTGLNDTLLYSPTFEIRRKVARRVRKFTTDGPGQDIRQRKKRILRQHNPFPKNLADHIVICDASPTFPRNVEYLVQSLKTAFSDDRLAIVILAVAHPPRVQALTLRDFANVYVVDGNPLLAQDLSRTYVERARGVIVLSNAKHHHQASHRLVDCSAVLCEMNIRSWYCLHPRRFSVVEMIHRLNIKYIDGETPLKSEELYATQLLRPSFISGNVFIPTMLDVMMSHAYFNPHILDVYKHLIFSHDHFTTPHPTLYPEESPPGSPVLSPQQPRQQPHQPPPHSGQSASATLTSQSGQLNAPALFKEKASGAEGPKDTPSSVTTPPSSHSSTRTTGQRPSQQPPTPGKPHRPSVTIPKARGPLPSIAELTTLTPLPYSDLEGYRFGRPAADLDPPSVVKAHATATRTKRRITRGRVFLVSLPPAYIAAQRTYGSLFTDLLTRHDAVAMGLYRTVTRANGTTFRCVLLNPATSTPLDTGDEAYVIAQQCPQWALSTCGPNSRRGSTQHGEIQAEPQPVDLLRRRFQQPTGQSAATVPAAKGLKGTERQLPPGEKAYPVPAMTLPTTPHLRTSTASQAAQRPVTYHGVTGGRHHGAGPPSADQSDLSSLVSAGLSNYTFQTYVRPPTHTLRLSDLEHLHRLNGLIMSQGSTDNDRPDLPKVQRRECLASAAPAVASETSPGLNRVHRGVPTATALMPKVTSHPLGLVNSNTPSTNHAEPGLRRERRTSAPDWRPTDPTAGASSNSASATQCPQGAPPPPSWLAIGLPHSQRQPFWSQRHYQPDPEPADLRYPARRGSMGDTLFYPIPRRRVPTSPPDLAGESCERYIIQGGVYETSSEDEVSDDALSVDDNDIPPLDLEH